MSTIIEEIRKTMVTDGHNCFLQSNCHGALMNDEDFVSPQGVY